MKKTVLLLALALSFTGAAKTQAQEREGGPRRDREAKIERERDREEKPAAREKQVDRERLRDEARPAPREREFADRGTMDGPRGRGLGPRFAYRARGFDGPADCPRCQAATPRFCPDCGRPLGPRGLRDGEGLRFRRGGFGAGPGPGPRALLQDEDRPAPLRERLRMHRPPLHDEDLREGRGAPGMDRDDDPRPHRPPPPRDDE